MKKLDANKKIIKDIYLVLQKTVMSYKPDSTEVTIFDLGQIRMQ